MKDSFVVALYCLLALSAYFLIFYRDFFQALDNADWLIAPVMALGSFVAGSTCLGGGAIAFPAMTKLMQIAAFDAKTFSLAIQSVGMTSASLFILLRVRTLPWTFILPFLLAACLGTTVSLILLSQHIAPADVRIAFTIFALSFLLVFLKTHRIHSTLFNQLKFKRKHIFTILICGLGGGILSGLLGSGADLLAFAILVLHFRMDPKLATQSSVIIMAVTSIAGMLIHNFYLGDISKLVMSLWFIAAPVVIIGAPIGALLCHHIHNRVLIYMVTSLILIEAGSTVLLVPFNRNNLIYHALAGSIALISLHLLQKNALKH